MLKAKTLGNKPPNSWARCNTRVLTTEPDCPVMVTSCTSEKMKYSLLLVLLPNLSYRTFDT